MKDNIVIVIWYNIEFALQENITCGLTQDQVSIFLMMLADDCLFKWNGRGSAIAHWPTTLLVLLITTLSEHRGNKGHDIPQK